VVGKTKNGWRRWGLGGTGLAVAFAGVFALVRIARPASVVPTVEVRKGEFTGYVVLRGEVRAARSTTIAAPWNAGDLEIVKLAHNGAQVHKGDVVIQFDTTKLDHDLAQNRSALKAAEAAIEQSRAQARMKEEQDKTDVMKARYDVEAAKLDASKEEILSKIDGQEAQLKLADTQQALAQKNAQYKSDQAGDAADLESKKQARDKALFEVNRTERSIAVLTLRAPSDGLVTLMNNWRAGGPFGNGSEFKEGDRAWSGAAIAELPDLSTLQISARVDEIDRGRVTVGDSTVVRVDALPDRQFNARIARISPLASTDFSAGWPFPRNFQMELTLDQTDSRLRPGMSANLRVAVERMPNVILIPPEAAFLKSGRTVTYVQHGSSFEERPIEVAKRSEGQLQVAKGLKPGELVATRDPTQNP
jgi:HlyD family secretion protein